MTDTEESLGAVIRLLSLVIKRVPPEVLVARFSQVNEILLTMLGRHSSSSNVSLLRGLLGCLSVVLRVQPAQVWSLPETGNVFQALLSYTTHSKPKVLLRVFVVPLCTFHNVCPTRSASLASTPLLLC